MPSYGGAASIASTTMWWGRATTTRWRTSRAASSRRWPSAGRRPRSPARASCTSSAAGSTRKVSAGSVAATCFRHRTPLFVPAAPDGPLAEGYRAAGAKGPVVDFFADYEIALRIMGRYMPPGPGTSAIFLGGGVPKDFIQITATSVKTIRGDTGPSPHLAAIQITTDNTVFGGLGRRLRGQRVHLVGQGSGGRCSTSCSSPTSRSPCRSSARGCSSATGPCTSGARGPRSGRIWRRYSATSVGFARSPRGARARCRRRRRRPALLASRTAHGCSRPPRAAR